MNNNNTTFDSFHSFELYLEGVKVPFLASFSITETLGNFPTAEIHLPSTSGIFKILPNTIVQIFGPDPVNKRPVLLFEGEIKSVSYQKNSEARYVSFMCGSFIANWSKTSVIPADSFITNEYREALSGASPNIAYNKKSKDVPHLAETVDGVKPSDSSKAENLDKLLSDILGGVSVKLTKRQEFADELGGIVNSDKVKEGDLHSGIEFFLTAFSRFNVWYGSEAIAQRIIDSVFTFPNKSVAAHRQAFNASILKSMTEDSKNMATNGSLLLLNAVYQYLAGFEYSYISPAAPTGIYNPYAKENKDQRAPGRFISMPSLELAPPIKCNLFFPHQVDSLSYSRNFEGEPSRTIGSFNFEMMSSGSLNIQGANYYGLYPSLQINEVISTQEYKANLSVYEWITGLKPLETNFSETFVHFANEYKKKYQTGIINESDEKLLPAERDAKDKGDSRTEFQKYKAIVLSVLDEMTERQHIKAILAPRNLSMSVTWSPYRIIGAPAAYIETEEGPSFTGIITSIRTNFDGSGNIKSAITLGSCRAIEDISKYSEALASKSIFDYAQDPFVDSSPSLFDPEIYSYSKIGKTVYPYLIKGSFNKSMSFSQPALAEIQKLGTDLDYSILSYIPKEGDKYNTSLTNPYMPKGLLRPSSFTYTQLIYEGIYRLRGWYKELIANRDMEAVENLINTEIRRELVPKFVYLNFLGVSLNNLENAVINSYRDSNYFLNKEEDIEYLNADLTQSSGVEPELVLDLKTKLSTARQTVKDLMEVARPYVYPSIPPMLATGINPNSPYRRKEYEGVDPLTFNPFNYLEHVKPPVPQLLTDLAERYNVINLDIAGWDKELKEYTKEVSTIQKEEPAVYEPGQPPYRPGFDAKKEEGKKVLESNLKKFYNITRRAHVNTAISRLLTNQNNEFLILK